MTELVVAGVPVGGCLDQRPDPRVRGRIVHRRWSSPTRRSTARPASGWPAGSASAWPAPASVAHNGSGEIFLGFGTGMRLDRETGRPDRTDLVTGPGLNALFSAVVEATEESVLNSMFEPHRRRSAADGNTSESLHSPEVLALLEGVRS